MTKEEVHASGHYFRAFPQPRGLMKTQVLEGIPIF
jgi:hypothetical protein